MAHKQKYIGALRGLGKAMDDTGKHEKALAEYDRFLRTNDSKRNLAIAHVNRGVALARLGKHDEALAEYGKALQDSPGDVLILVNLAVEMAASGDLDEGIVRPQNVVDEKGNADKHVDEVTLPSLIFGSESYSKKKLTGATPSIRSIQQRRGGRVMWRLTAGWLTRWLTKAGNLRRSRNTAQLQG